MKSRPLVGRDREIEIVTTFLTASGRAPALSIGGGEAGIGKTRLAEEALAWDGMGLGTMWGREKAREMLREAGFDDIRIETLDHDPQNEYYVIGKR